jgi:cell division protein FtsW
MAAASDFSPKIGRQSDVATGLFVSIAGAIVGFGLVMVYSASITSWPTDFERVYLSRQLTALAVGVALGFACASVPAQYWRRAAPYLLFATVLLLVVVLMPGIGTRVNGARRWLRHARMQFQPSELAKIALILYACGEAQRFPSTPQSLRSLVRLVGPVLLTASLVAVEPDLGTSLFLLLFAGIALFCSGWPLRHFLFAALLAFPAAGFAVLLRPYQMRRVTGFLSVWTDWSGVPYQLEQSLISLGAGGLYGVGLGKGWQKLSFLPEANTDFVFAVVGEELGLVGTLGLLTLWGAFYFSGLRAIQTIRDRFAHAAAFCLLTQMVMQAAINMAVVTALLPPKGIPLPLVSYGGSALVVSLASLGIIVSLARGPNRSLIERLTSSGWKFHPASREAGHLPPPHVVESPQQANRVDQTLPTNS